MEQRRPYRVAVLISGNGSNLQALIDAVKDGRLPRCEIVRVLSNRKGVKGLERAEKAGIPTLYHNLLSYSKRYPSKDPNVKHSPEARAEYDEELARLLLKDKPDLIVCAGFMHILSPIFLSSIAVDKVAIINLHPALPGAFSGAGAIQRAYDAFQKGEIEKTGLMIHYVIAEVDMGEPIVVREIPLRKGESLDDLETRVHEIEHQAIVEGARLAIERLP